MGQCNYSIGAGDICPDPFGCCVCEGNMWVHVPESHPPIDAARDAPIDAAADAPIDAATDAFGSCGPLPSNCQFGVVLGYNPDAGPICIYPTGCCICGADGVWHTIGQCEPPPPDAPTD